MQILGIYKILAPVNKTFYDIPQEREKEQENDPVIAKSQEPLNLEEEVQTSPSLSDVGTRKERIQQYSHGHETYMIIAKRRKAKTK